MIDFSVSEGNHTCVVISVFFFRHACDDLICELVTLSQGLDLKMIIITYFAVSYVGM